MLAGTYAYFNGTITTIEKRYRIPSRNTGIISTGNDISSAFVSAILSYYGGKGHRPRWMAMGKWFKCIITLHSGLHVDRFAKVCWLWWYFALWTCCHICYMALDQMHCSWPRNMSPTILAAIVLNFWQTRNGSCCAWIRVMRTGTPHWLKNKQIKRYDYLQTQPEPTAIRATPVGLRRLSCSPLSWSVASAKRCTQRWAPHIWMITFRKPSRLLFSVRTL